MKRLVAVAAAAAAMFTALGAAAAPIEFDTESAHVVVVRPVDRWSGDTTALEVSLDAVKNRQTSYMMVNAEGKYLRGSPLPLQGISDDPVVHAAKAALETRSFELIRRQRYFFHVLQPVSLSPDELLSFAQAQTAAYRRVGELEGDPDTLQARVAGHRFIGNVVALATLGIGVHKLGVGLGSELILDHGVVGGIQQLSGRVFGAFVPVPTKSLEGSYQQIDVRRVDYRNDMIGQIVIAYRTPKTPEAEIEALSRAIVSIAGADTTPEDIERSRMAELEVRRGIWRDCLAANRCPQPKDGADATSDSKSTEESR
jgi:hypothetical protein